MSDEDRFDPKLLPHVAAYVASLPRGLESFPECRVRTVVNRAVSERHPEVFRHPGVPSRFRDLAHTQAKRADWVPEVVGVATRLLVRDVLHSTDQAYLQWTYDLSAEVFARPFYRMLWYVMSPTLLLMGASKRWSAFREGTTLTAKSQNRGGQLELRFPPGLYPELTLQSFGEAFRASVMAARARRASIELTLAEPGLARWAVSWT